MIVDDEPLFRDAVSLTLRKHGFDVLKAEGPSQALQIVGSQVPIDVVLSDIWMPGMLGTDLVREIGQSIPHSACILMTAASAIELQDVPQGVPLLRKPISSPDLIAAIKNAIARSIDLRAKLQQAIAKNTRLRLECENVLQ